MREAPDLMTAVRNRLRERPLDRSDNPGRRHRLRPPLDTKRIGDRLLPQWQDERPPAGDELIWLMRRLITGSACPARARRHVGGCGCA
jgi:hypothetical protein